MVSSMTKTKDRYSDDRVERDYIKRMSLRDTRTWFRQRSRMTLRIKANISSVFTENMGCRYCEEDIRIENQEHLVQCKGFSYEQRGLDLSEEMGKQIKFDWHCCVTVGAVSYFVSFLSCTYFSFTLFIYIYTYNIN